MKNKPKLTFGKIYTISVVIAAIALWTFVLSNVKADTTSLGAEVIEGSYSLFRRD